MNTLAQTRDMVHRHRQETWYTGTDKRHGTQTRRHDIHRHIQRHGTHCHIQRHGIHLHKQETWYTGTNKRKDDIQAHKQGDMVYTGAYLLEQKTLYTVTNKRNLIQRHSNKET